MSKTKTITMPRDAKTGRIVSRDYAEKHPSTTIVEKHHSIVVDYKVAREVDTGRFTTAKQERSLTHSPSENKAMSAAKSLAGKKGFKE